MTERTEEDQAIIEKSNLWRSFVDTEYSRDLNAFFIEQEKLGRQGVCDLTMNGHYEEAKAAAHKISGILAVKEYISSCISGMDEILEMEKENKRYRKGIPKHV